MGTATQLRAVSSLTSVLVADVDLPVADSMRVLGVTLDRHLTFDNHASAVARSCNYHARAIRHIRHLLTLDFSTDACMQPDSLENRLLQLCAARRSIQHHSETPASPEQRRAYRSTSASRVRRQLAAPDAALLPVEQRINYKLAVLTFKTQQTSSPQYLSLHISLRTSARNTRSSSVPLMRVPFRRTSFARRSFSTAAPMTWNSLPPAVLNCDSLSTFKSRLKTHLFSTAFC